jgi:tetratricopeptide (TPR) repeat protein
LGAWDYIARALPLFWRLSEQEMTQAVALARAALELDPSYAQAHSFLARCFPFQAQMGWIDAATGVSLGVRHARVALAMDHTDAPAHLGLGYAHLVARRANEAISEFEVAVELDPNFAWARLWLASAFAFSGDGTRALEEVSIAHRMSPKDPFGPAFRSVEAMANFVLRRYDVSADLNRLAVSQSPGLTSAYRTMTAALALAGRLHEAREALNATLAMQPALSAAWVEESHPLARQEDRRLYVEGLRLAGLPE